MDTQDSAGTSGARRVRTALAGAVLAVGLLAPVPAAAQPVPAQPTPRATATTTAPTATGPTGTTAQQASTTPQQAGTTAESTVTNGSLSRKKTIAALVLGFVVALAAAVLVYRRSARDNRLG